MKTLPNHKVTPALLNQVKESAAAAGSISELVLVISEIRTAKKEDLRQVVITAAKAFFEGKEITPETVIPTLEFNSASAGKAPCARGKYGRMSQVCLYFHNGSIYVASRSNTTKIN